MDSECNTSRAVATLAAPMKALPDEAMRLLELVPLSGPVLSLTLERNGGDLSRLDELAEAGLILIARTTPNIILLTATGVTIRSELDLAIACPPIPASEALDKLRTGSVAAASALRACPLRTLEIARVLELRVNVVQGILNRAESRGLIAKEGDYWSATPEGLQLSQTAVEMERLLTSDTKLELANLAA